MHYESWRRHGDPLARKPLGRPAEERFWEKVDKDGPLFADLGPCWLWTGGTSYGYGLFWNVPAHRWAYENLVGPIPPGLHIDHLCRNPPCVNPAHLEPVTVRENTLRGVGTSAQNARKTYCIHGHPFSDENTYRPPSGGRYCRTCLNAGYRAYRKRRAER